MARTMFENLNAIVANTLTDSIKMIDIDELHESKDNFFVVDRVEEFAETILGQGGVKDNLLVRPLETGGYEIISGHRRRAAVQYLLDNGENVSRYLPCLVQSYNNDDTRMLDIVLMNVSARQISDPELWKSYEIVDQILKSKKSAGEKFGRVREKLAECLGVSPAQVGKMQNVDKNAIPAVKEAVENGKISISTANEIAKLDEETQERLAESDLSNVKRKEVKKISENTTAVKWDGIFAKDIIKQHLMVWVGSENLTAAKTMNNGDFSDLIRQSNRNHGSVYDDVSVNGHFDKIRITFFKPMGCDEIDNSSISAVDLTWTMAARHIRAWVLEERGNEMVSEESARYEKKKSKYAPIEKKVDTSINFSETDSYDSEDAAESDTDDSAVDTSINFPETDSEDIEEAVEPIEETAKVDTSSNLAAFVHKNYYELESIFEAYISLTSDDDEAKLLEEFLPLLREVRENVRNQVRFGF